MNDLSKILEIYRKEYEDRIKALKERINDLKQDLSEKSQEDIKKVNEMTKSLIEQGEDPKEWEYEILSLSDALANESDDDLAELDKMENCLEELLEDLGHINALINSNQ